MDIINKKNRSELKSYFVKNSIPTENQFAELIDGMLNLKEDGIAKSAAEPLSIQAAIDSSTGLKKAINFYENFQDANPAWTLLLNPRTDPTKPETAKSGFCISDGQGINRLFIDKNTGYVGITGGVGIGATIPEYKFHVVADNEEVAVFESKASNAYLYLGTLNDNENWGTIGNEQGNLSIGTAYHPKALSISTEGNVDINGHLRVTGEIQGDSALNFGNQVRQIINMWNNTYGIGIQNNTQYFRTAKNFAWYKGGVYINDELNSGLGGTVQMVIKDGNVGIGTTTPAAKLTIQTPDQYTGRTIRFETKFESSKYYLNLNTVVTDSVVRWVFDQTNAGISYSNVLAFDRGNIGIGTNEPKFKLHVKSDVVAAGLFESTQNMAVLKLWSNEGEKNGVEIANRPGGRLSLWTSGAGDVLNITRDGKVGIGTSTPRRKFQIGADISGLGFDHGLASPDCGIFRFGDNTGWKLHFGRSREIAGADTDADDIALNTGISGVLMTIQDNGNVGIGTTNPGTTLDIYATKTIVEFNSWYEAIRFSQGSHSAITHPGGGLLFGMNSDRHFYFADTVNKHYAMTIDAPTGDVKIKGAIYTENSDIYFTKTDHDSTAIGDTSGCAAIQNAKNYDALMILGRAGTTKGRTVKLWDYLQVNGTLEVLQTINDHSARLQFSDGLLDIHPKSNNGIRLHETNNVKRILNSLGKFIMVDVDTGKYFNINYDGQGNINFYHNTGFGQFMNANGQWNLGSDRSLKQNITAIGNILDKVIKLAPVNFKWRHNQQEDIGFIAQDVEEVFPELVSSVSINGVDTKALPYTSFGVLAIAAIQELASSFEQRIKVLEDQILVLSHK